MLKAQGIWGCTVLSATAGETDKGSPNIQINVVIDDGPSKGQRCTYEDQINAKSALYVARSMKAVGWRGGSVTTLAADCDEWVKKTGGKSTVEIKHVEIKRGKQYDRWVEEGMKGPSPVWDKPNSIGRGAAAPLKPMNEERLADADEALRAALEADGQKPLVNGGGSAADEYAGGRSGDYTGAPVNDDVPFATCSTIALGEIAKVLR